MRTPAATSSGLSEIAEIRPASVHGDKITAAPRSIVVIVFPRVKIVKIIDAGDNNGQSVRNDSSFLLHARKAEESAHRIVTSSTVPPIPKGLSPSRVFDLRRERRDSSFIHILYRTSSPAKQQRDCLFIHTLYRTSSIFFVEEKLPACNL